MIPLLVLALSLLVVAANVAVVAVFVLRWDRRARQPAADGPDRAFAQKDAG